jgi:hypothetical protein
MMAILNNIMNKIYKNETSNIENNDISIKPQIKPIQNVFTFTEDLVNDDIDETINYSQKNNLNNFFSREEHFKITTTNDYKFVLNKVLNLYFNKNYRFKLEKDQQILRSIYDLKNLLNTSLIQKEKIRSFINFTLDETKIQHKILIIDIYLKYDPILNLLKQLHFEHLESKIIIVENNDEFLFTPSHFMPTHVMAFIRDLIDANIETNFPINNIILDQSILRICWYSGYGNTYNFYNNSICNKYLSDTLNIFTDIKYMFEKHNLEIDSNNFLYFNKLSNIFINDKEIYDSTSGLNFIELITIEELNSITTRCLNKYNYGSSNFTVINKEFFAGDGKGSELCEQFIKFANNKYSFMKKFSSAFACEGGFTFDYHHSYDPLLYFANSSPMYVSSRTDLRGNRDFHRHYSTNMWYLFILYYWLNEYGIETTELVCNV